MSECECERERMCVCVCTFRRVCAGALALLSIDLRPVYLTVSITAE